MIYRCILTDDRHMHISEINRGSVRIGESYHLSPMDSNVRLVMIHQMGTGDYLGYVYLNKLEIYFKDIRYFRGETIDIILDEY